MKRKVTALLTALLLTLTLCAPHSGVDGIRRDLR